MLTARHDRATPRVTSSWAVPARSLRTSPGGGPARPARRRGRPPRARWATAVGALAVLAGCASLTGHEATPAGPGVPRLLTARFEPDRVHTGEETTLVLTFEATEANVVEAYLVPRVVDDFRLIASTSAIQRNIRRHFGEVVGTVREAFTWENPSIRLYDVYVVDIKGNASNRIPIRVTVR